MRWYGDAIRLLALASAGSFIGITGTRAIVMNHNSMISGCSGMAGVGKAMIDGAVNICDCGLASAAGASFEPSLGVTEANFGAMRASLGAADFSPEISGHPTTVWLPTSKKNSEVDEPC